MWTVFQRYNTEGNMADHGFSVLTRQRTQQIAKPFGGAADFGAPDVDDTPTTTETGKLEQHAGTKRLLDSDEDVIMDSDGVQRKRRKKKTKATTQQEKNALMLINEMRPELDFVLISQDGPPHAPTFVVTVDVDGQNFEGTGASKQKAKRNAAEKILSSLNIPYNNPSENITMDLSNVKDEKPAITPMVKPPVMLLNELHDGKLDYQFEMGQSQQEPFICTIEIQGKEFTGTGLSKKKAKLVVASKALEEIHGVVNLNAGQIIMPSSKSNKHVLIAPPPESQLPQKMADTIAEITLNRYKELSSGEINRKVLAGIVMTRRNEIGDLSYEVISIGTGTKFIGGEYISEKGYAINDCHGEIIARRGLRRYLYSQLEAYTEQGDTDTNIFIKKESGLFGLKNGIEFHLYISMSPCGDARVFSPHECQAGEVDDHAARKKRGLLRVKLENGEGTIPVANFDIPIQTWDGVLGSEKLRTMSCSDKVCKWNILGLQGALLSNFIEPIYLTSITLGSLYRYDHMSRAIYGRLGVIDNLTPLYKQNKPLMTSVSHPETRQPGKAPKNSINWTTGDSNIENVSTLTGKLTETNQPSQICKQAMFAKFCTLWRALKGDMPVPGSYHDAKVASKGYQQAKELMVNAFERNGLGRWLKKPIEQDWFQIIG